MTDRWFSREELEQLSRPTMDRAIEAIDAGDLEPARRAVRGDEARVADAARPDGRRGARPRLLHPAASSARRGSREAWEHSMERGWRHHHDAIEQLDRRDASRGCSPPPGAPTRARASARNPGSFTISEDEEKVTFSMNPCGSGQRLVRNGAYEGLPDGGRTREAHDWSFNREGFPLVLHPLQLHERVAADPVVGLPAVPAATRPTTTRRIPARWYWYKDPAKIPERSLAPLRRRQAGRGVARARSRWRGSAARAGRPGCSRRTAPSRSAIAAPDALALGELDEVGRRPACCASARRGSARAAAWRRAPCSRRPG